MKPRNRRREIQRWKWNDGKSVHPKDWPDMYVVARINGRGEIAQIKVTDVITPSIALGLAKIIARNPREAGKVPAYIEDMRTVPPIPLFSIDCSNPNNPWSIPKPLNEAAEHSDIFKPILQI